MLSDELPNILERMYQPPRRSNRKRRKRPKAASATLNELSIRRVQETIEKEMRVTAPLFKSSPDDLSEDKYTHPTPPMHSVERRLQPSCLALRREA